MGEDIPHEMDLAPLPGTSDEFFTNSFPEDKEGRYTLYKYDLLNRLVSVSRLNENNPLRFVDPTGLEWSITNTFGAEGPYKDTNGLHSGIDMIWVEKDGSNGTTGQTVLPLEPGIVSFIKNDTKGGKTVFIKHKDNRRSTYQHNTEILVNVGDEVNLDTPIAYAGNDGENSTGPHVHVDIYNNTGSPAGQKIKPVLEYGDSKQYYIEPSERLVTDYIDRMTEAAEQAGREECTK